jgi:outer membrane protein
LKKIIKSIAITAAASSMLLTGAVFAAQQKIAVVNVQDVMSKIPQTAAIMQSLEAEFKDDKAVLAQLEKDIKYYQEKKKRDGALMAKKEIAELDKKIGDYYRDYQTKGKAFQQKTGARQNEETNKILALVRQAIDNIAAKGKYDLILEQKAVVFSKPESDISEEVVKQVSKLN